MQNTAPNVTIIYKILTPGEWTTFCRDGETQGSGLDRADGFLHFSTRPQLLETLAKHFTGKGPLVLAEIPLSKLVGQDVRWEEARNGALFPHLYGILACDSVSQHWPLHPDDAGDYALPELFGT